MLVDHGRLRVCMAQGAHDKRQVSLARGRGPEPQNGLSAGCATAKRAFLCS
jgi:hypothetical protein